MRDISLFLRAGFRIVALVVSFLAVQTVAQALFNVPKIPTAVAVICTALLAVQIWKE